MKKSRKSISKKPTFEPDVIEKDLYKFFPKEWLRNAAKETGLIKRERKNRSLRNALGSRIQFRFSSSAKSCKYEAEVRESIQEGNSRKQLVYAIYT